MLLSSDASDNLLLFVTVEGPVVTVVDWFTGSYIISKGVRFLRPFLHSGMEMIPAGGWDISVQWPCVSRIPRAWPCNKIESSVRLLPMPPGALQIPQTCHCWWILPPKWIHALHWPTAGQWEVPSHYPSLPVLPAESTDAVQLSAQAPQWDWSLVWGFLCRKPSRRVQALRPIVSCNAICPMDTVDESCALDQ